MDALFSAVEAAQQRLPRDTFDPKAVVEAVGADPRLLLTWVRDETYLVSYEGVLRGARGVLLDRLGNSLDRALLLAELVRQAGHTVRIARGSLSAQQARDVLSRARPVPPDGLAAWRSTGSQDDELFRVITEQTQVDSAMLRTAVANRAAEQQSLKQRVTERISAQSAFLLGLVTPPATQQTTPRVIVGTPGTHWWVQVQQGDQWVDLDPTLPDAAPGRAVTAVDGTMNPEELPDSLHHEVRVRVLIERWQQGRREELQVANFTLRPSRRPGEHATLSHMPVNAPPDPKAASSSQDLRAMVLGQREWLPLLRVGSDTLFERTFTDRGETREGTEVLTAEAFGFGALGRGVQDILGSGRLGGPGRETPSAADGPVVSAEWVEYEVRTPGRASQVQRRQVFDLLGPAARAAGTPPATVLSEAQRSHRAQALFGQVIILPLVGFITPAFVEYLSASNLLENRATLRRMADAASDREAFASSAGELAPLPYPLYALALARQEWAEDHRVYLDQQNVFTYRSDAFLSERGNLEIRQGFDIVVNDVAAFASAPRPFAARLQQGVLDTNAEAVLLGTGAPVENAAEVLALASRQGVSVVLLRSAGDRALSRLQLPENARVRIKEGLSAGFHVVAPERPVSQGGRSLVAWWRIHPASGQSLGISQEGFGAGTELTLQQKQTLEKIRLAMEYGRMLMYLLSLYLCGRESTPERQAACFAIATGGYLVGASAWMHPNPIVGLGLAAFMVWFFGVGRTACRAFGGPCP